MTNQEKSFTSYPIFIQDLVRTELGNGIDSPNWDHLPSIKMEQASRSNLFNFLLWQNDNCWLIPFFHNSLIQDSDEIYNRLMLNI